MSSENMHKICINTFLIKSLENDEFLCYLIIVKSYLGGIMKNKILSVFMAILGCTFTIFMVNCVIINSIFSFAFSGSLVKIEVNLIFLAVSLIISLFVVHFINKRNQLDVFLRLKGLYFASAMFTVLYFAEFTTYMILYANNIISYKWSIEIILLTLGFSAVEFIINQFLKISYIVVKITSQFVLTAGLYFGITLGFFGLGGGNSIITVIGIYIVLFTVILSIYLLINHVLKINKEKNKEYTNQF
jgi:hypothetical protein